MTTGNTSLLGLALPVQGELDGQWGDVVNESITSLLDTAIAGTTTLSADSDVTLTTTALAANQARQAVLLCTGARTDVRTITAPAQSKVYVIINATTGDFPVKIVGVGPTTGVMIPFGSVATVAWNGSDFVLVSNPYVNYVAGKISGTVGYPAGSGTNNVLAGLNAGSITATGAPASIGSFNICLGADAGRLYVDSIQGTLGSDNVLIGSSAGKITTTVTYSEIGNNNVIIGANAGTQTNKTLGAANLILGAYAGQSLPDGIGNAVVIGGALPDESAVATGDVLIGNGTVNTLFHAVWGSNAVGFSGLTVFSDYTQLTGGFGAKAPTTVSASTYTVLDDAYSLIFATTNCTVTLPSASANTGRVLILKNRTANSVVSASSNVVPPTSATAGTAILAATAGKFSYLQSDGTNWVVLMSN